MTEEELTAAQEEMKTRMTGISPAKRQALAEAIATVKEFVAMAKKMEIPKEDFEEMVKARWKINITAGQDGGAQSTRQAGEHLGLLDSDRTELNFNAIFREVSPEIKEKYIRAFGNPNEPRPEPKRD